MSHSIGYLRDSNDDFNHLRGDASGNLLVGMSGTWADEMVEDTDQIVSKLTDMTTHTGLISSRASNIQDWVGTGGGDGTGVKTGVNIAEILVDTDQIVSKLTDVSSHTTLISSRSSNIQDWVGTAGGDGTGVKTGVNIDTMRDDIATIKSYQFSITGTQGNLMSSASCVAAGTTSSVIDWFATGNVPKRLSVIVTASASIASTGVEVYGSADNSTWGRLNLFTLSNSNPAGGTYNTTGGVVMDWSMRYLKIIVYSLGTYTATAVGLS